MRAMTSPRRTSAPSCDSTQVSTPSRSDFVVERSSSRRACAASLSSEPRSSDEPFELHARWRARRSCARSRSCASSICACLTASSERRSASREKSPSLNSCWSPSSCDCADCSSSVFTSIRPSRSTSDFSSVSRVCACWFSLILRSLTTLSSASTDSLMSSSTTGSPRFRWAPGRCRSRSTRASSGLESTRSTSGTTVPDAMITASTGPAVTRAVRIRARLTDGRIQPGSQMIRHRQQQERQADARQRAALRLRLNFGSQLAIHGPAHIKACAGERTAESTIYGDSMHRRRSGAHEALFTSGH